MGGLSRLTRFSTTGLEIWIFREKALTKPPPCLSLAASFDPMRFPHEALFTAHQANRRCPQGPAEDMPTDTIECTIFLKSPRPREGK